MDEKDLMLLAENLLEAKRATLEIINSIENVKSDQIVNLSQRFIYNEHRLNTIYLKLNDLMRRMKRALGINVSFDEEIDPINLPALYNMLLAHLNSASSEFDTELQSLYTDVVKTAREMVNINSEILTSVYNNIISEAKQGTGWIQDITQPIDVPNLNGAIPAI